ncbi:MAG: hypothetical protein ABI852_09275 [Gemmatimonadaceae bacterium]
MRTWQICSALLLTLAVGCARNKTAATHAAATGDRPSDVITAAELSDVSVSNGDALAAVRRLRPRFLTGRGSGSIRASDAGNVHVSLDGGPLQTVNFLSRMRPGEIAEIRYLNASEAALRFGTIAGTGGVMLVKSR